MSKQELKTLPSSRGAGSSRMKGITGDLVKSAIVLVVFGMVLVIGAEFMGQVQSTQTTNSLPYNITVDVLSGLTTFGNWVPILALALILIVVVTLLVNAFLNRRSVG